jgi:hypothetical protein
MKWLFVRAATLAAAVSSAAALSACFAAAAGAAVGVGAYAYTRGELRTSLPASLDDAYRASRTALEELKLPIVGGAKDAFGARPSWRRRCRAAT